MKFLAVIVLACLVASISSAPTQITDNNVGNIVTVGVKAGIDINSEVDVTLINIIAALINQNLAVIAPAAPLEGETQPIDPAHMIEEQPSIPNLPKITPEMIEKFRGILSNLK